MDLRSPSCSEHLEALAELYGHTFSEFWQLRDIGTTSYFVQSPYDWDTSRIAVEDGGPVAHFGVWDFQMRIGVARVRLAGVGAVATARPHRKRGLMDGTVSACLEAMRSSGYQMSLLFGIPKFYRRYGYVSTFSENLFVLDAREVPLREPAVAFDVYADEDARSMERFAEQYNEENDGVTGTFVRPTFLANPKRPNWRGYTFDGGYLVAGVRNGKLEIADCAGPPESIVDIAAQLARTEVTPEIRFVFLPARSRMGAYLQHLNHRRHLRHFVDGGPMLKVVNLEATLSGIAPEVERRLEASPLAGYSGSVGIRGDGEAVTLVFSKGRLVRTGSEDAHGQGDAVDGGIDGGTALGRLVIGDDEPEHICRQAGITVSGDAVRLLPILFPNQEPSTVLWDRF